MGAVCSKIAANYSFSSWLAHEANLKTTKNTEVMSQQGDGNANLRLDDLLLKDVTRPKRSCSIKRDTHRGQLVSLQKMVGVFLALAISIS